MKSETTIKEHMKKLMVKQGKYYITSWEEGERKLFYSAHNKEEQAI